MNNKKLIIGITAPQSVMLLQGQLKYFVEKYYKVYLLAPKNEQTIEFCTKEGAILLPISIKREISPFHDLWSLFQIIRVFIRIKPDIVNLGTPKVSLLGMIAAKITGVKKRIYTCRGFRFEHEAGSLKKILILMERLTASYANKVLCISKSVRDLGIEYNIFSEEKSIVIHKGSSNGLDLNLYNRDNLDPKRVRDLKQKHNPDDKFVFGFLGRIVARKGFKELLQAFDRVYQNDKNVQLLVVGRPYYDQMDKDTIERAYSHPGIDMVGRVEYEDTPYYYNLMHVFVLPAYWEGFGNVLIQAAAMELPIISTDVTGCKDAVSDAYNGKLIEPKNIDLLYKTMIDFQNNSQLRKEYSINAKEWVQHFKPEMIWQGMEDLYQN